jgi:beta-phosphoglucomutase-like phosphatase (HAD superfamily)
MGFMPSQCVVVEDSEVGIEAAVAAGMKAFKYAQNGETSPCRAENEVSFDNMSQLSQLLTHFASNARPINAEDTAR